MEKLTQIEKIRHSLAHLLGASVVKLYPGSKITLGPAIENGFYYDIDVNGKITDADLAKIEKTMRVMLKSWDIFEKKILRKALLILVFQELSQLVLIVVSIILFH